MKTSWLIGAFITFIIGFILTLTIIGAIIGVPLILLSLILLIVGFFVPGSKTEVHVHHHYSKKK
jgi:uncharacterized membrane protein